MILVVLASSTLSFANEGGIELQQAHVNVSNKASLQRGAKLYMNHCAGCHSLKYLRYSQLAKGLGLMTYEGDIDKPLLQNNLVFTKSTVGDAVQISMPPESAREWFGKVPPDLSLVARVRGADWLYTYLKSFYQDSSKPFGANNWLFPDVAMPNVLAPLQGIQQADYETKEIMFEGKVREEKFIAHLSPLKDGAMTEHQFDSSVNDVVSFLVYVGEPVQKKREWLGFWAIGFVLILTGLFYGLKKSYWSELKLKK